MAQDNPKVVREEVDIDKESSELTTSDASLDLLDALDKEEGIKGKHLRSKAILYVSIAVIVSILITGVGVIALSQDESSKDWARQILFTLLGFAAGAMWPNSQNGDSNSNS